MGLTKCTEHTLHRVCMCTQENTSVILQPSSNFGVIKSFHNGPIETTDASNRNVSDENLYTAQKNSLLLDTIIMQSASPKAMKSNLKNLIQNLITEGLMRSGGAESSELGNCSETVQKLFRNCSNFHEVPNASVNSNCQRLPGQPLGFFTYFQPGSQDLCHLNCLGVARRVAWGGAALGSDLLSIIIQ